MKSDITVPMLVLAGDNDKPSKRLSILQAAAATFCQEGYAGASIDNVASRAGVSRQTIYNHIGDKEKLFRAVVSELTERSAAAFFKLLEDFPSAPKDIEPELSAFAIRLIDLLVCDPNGRFLMRLVETEGTRYPELFTVWREYGPGRKYPAVTAQFALLAHAGYIEADDPSLAARQFMSLVLGDIRNQLRFGNIPERSEIETTVRDGVKTFLRAYGKPKN